MKFAAEHVAMSGSNSFLWNARVQLAPGVHLRVVDSLLAGQGRGRVSLMSVLPLANEHGTPEMHSGTLHRYLAEAVWYPHALLRSRQLSWVAASDNVATAALVDGDTRVTLDFRFASTGEVVGIYSEGRWGRFHGSYVRVPWEGRLGDYKRFGGVLVPTKAEVGWYSGSRLEIVWRATVDDVSTN